MKRCRHNVQHVGCESCLEWRRMFNNRRREAVCLRIPRIVQADPQVLPKRWGEDR